MTSNRWKSWRAKEPPATFTDRTVAALLRERRGGRAFTGRRWAIAGAMAAVLIGGTAWGLGGFSLGRRPLPAPPAPTVAPPAAPMPQVVHAPPVDVAPPAPPPSPSAPRRKVEAPPSVNSAGTGRKVGVPRCFCSPNEAICDCF